MALQQEAFYNTIIEELDNGKLVLPTLPDVALRVREVIDDPNATAGQLSDIIVTDAALSARLISVANSALYRGRIPTETVQMAVSRLGLGMVRNLVTSIVMEQMFKPQDKALEKRMRKLWEHSTQVAALSHVIANDIPSIKSDEAMLAGLIHEIGVLPILMKAVKQPELVGSSKTLNDIIDNLYPRIGQAILTKWEFPEALITAVAEHNNIHRNSGPTGPDICDVVQVASLQSYFDTDKALDPVERAKVVAFEKCGVDFGLSVDEIDENSDEYAEALALFNMA